MNYRLSIVALGLLLLSTTFAIHAHPGGLLTLLTTAKQKKQYAAADLVPLLSQEKDDDDTPLIIPTFEVPEDVLGYAHFIWAYQLTLFGRMS